MCLHLSIMDAWGGGVSPRLPICVITEPLSLMSRGLGEVALMICQGHLASGAWLGAPNPCLARERSGGVWSGELGATCTPPDPTHEAHKRGL